MQRELYYQIPLKQLRKVGRLVCRKAFPAMQLMWPLLALYLAGLIALAVFGHALDHWLTAAGIRYGVEFLFVSLVLLALASLWGLRRLQVSQVHSRGKFDDVIQLTQDDNGLRFTTENTEFYVKWRAISQLLLVHDGVVVSYGALFFLVPDLAFPDAGDRLAFTREVYSRLSDDARSISEKHIRAALSEQPSAA